MKRMIAFAMVCLFAAAPSGLAFAQAEDGGDEDGTPRIIYPKKTEIDFLKDRNIQGTLQGPGLEDYFVPPEPVFTPLIKLRGHFNPEIADSVNQL